MARARGANAIMAVAAETSYGVPPAGGYQRVPFVSSQLGAEQGLIESDLLGQGRAPADPTYDVVNNDGDIVVPLDTRALGVWLRLLFGPPVTAPTTGALYGHQFASGAIQLPSDSIEIAHPDRPSFSTHYGARANTLQIQMQRSGLTSATIGLIAKGETVASLTSNAGTTTSYGEVKRFAAASGYISVDGAQIGEVVSANISYSNGLDKDETIRADSEINDVDPGMPTASIALTLKFTDIVLLTKATSKTPVSVTLTWPYAAGIYFAVELPRVFLPRSKKPITGPGGIQVSVNGMASAGAGNLINISLNNDVPTYA